MKLQTTMKFAHLNLGREKAGEGDGDLRADLKLTATLHLKSVAKLLDQHAAATIEGLFDAEGMRRTRDFGTLKIAREYVGVKAEIAPDLTGQLDLDGDKDVRTPLKFEGDLNSIDLKPLDGRQIEVTMRLQVNPSEDQLARLGHLLRGDVKITVSGGLVKSIEDEHAEKEEEEEGAEA